MSKCWVDNTDESIPNLLGTEIAQGGEAQVYDLIDSANWTYSTPDVYLSDLHDENVIRSVRGNVFVIDCDIRINVPELHAGGVRHLTNEVIIL